jgi:tetratricopeptide (TPR) repeat protein
MKPNIKYVALWGSIITLLIIAVFIIPGYFSDNTGSIDQTVSTKPANIKLKNERKPSTRETGKNNRQYAQKSDLDATETDYSQPIQEKSTGNVQSEMMAALQKQSIPDQLKTQISEHLEQMDQNGFELDMSVFEQTPDSELTEKIDEDIQEELEHVTPEIKRANEDYAISDDQWESLLDEFQTINNPKNKQEKELKASTLMDMGTTMLMEQQYDHAQEAFEAVIEITPKTDAAKLARAGLIQTLIAQDWLDEAEKEIKTCEKLYKNDPQFTSWLQSLKK